MGAARRLKFNVEGIGRQHKKNQNIILDKLHGIGLRHMGYGYTYIYIYIYVYANCANIVSYPVPDYTLHLQYCTFHALFFYPSFSKSNNRFIITTNNK